MEQTYILVAEDESNIRDTILDMLTMEGYNVVGVENGAEALVQIHRKRPQLILSDIMMPEMDGYQLLEKVKSNPETELIPFLLITAKVEIESRMKGYSFGADDYITKPFVLGELMLKIKNLLKTREKLISSSLVVPQKPQAESDKIVFLRNLNIVLEANLSNTTLDLDFLVKKMGVSRSTLQKKIKLYTGKSTSTFIREFRLQRAKQLMDAQEGNLSQIAQKTGFSSISYFSVSFKSFFGYSPKKS